MTTEISVFVSVVKHSSFVRAAAEHGMTPSGVSRVVSRLEERLGARLLQRSTRKLSLTEAGAVFHARAVQLLLDLGEAEAEAAASSLRPRGLLRLNAPVAFGRQHIAPLLRRFRAQFPDLTVELTLTDRFVDLIEEGVVLSRDDVGRWKAAQGARLAWRGIRVGRVRVGAQVLAP